MAKVKDNNQESSKGTAKTAKAAVKKEVAKAAVQEEAAAPAEVKPERPKFYNPFQGVSKEDRRSRLRELMAGIKEQARIAGVTGTSNELLVAHYRNVCGAPFLRTIEEWNALGKRIRKGSEPFLLWDKMVTTGEGDDQRSYFPLKFVYDVHQVYTPIAK